VRAGPANKKWEKNTAMNLREYRERDAVGLAELIGRGDVSAAEVQDLARQAIEEVDPALNAVAGPLFGEALAHDSGGPFRGVPMMLKDLSASAAGVPSRSGSRLAGDGIVPVEDSGVVARFKGAGLAILGLTTTPELGICSTTESVLTGPTRNPWDLERSTGGSSGGSAALVAARAVPLGHANDAGGSIRMPAAWCGLVGLKPSRGRIPSGPATDPSPDFMNILVDFAVTRTVRDAAALLDAIHGPEDGELCAVAAPGRPFAAGIGDRPQGLRVAAAPVAWSPRPVDPEVQAAVEAAGQALADAGHRVDAAAPAFDYDRVLEAYSRLTSVLVARTVDLMAAASGIDPESGVLEASIAAYAALGRTVSGLDVAADQAVLVEARRSLGAFFREHDVLLVPTMTDPACPLGTIDANDPAYDGYAWQRRSFHFGPFAWPFNVTGQPAISLPLAQSAAGLPIGVQVVGRIGDDATVLGVAAQLEQALPWHDRVPGTAVGAAA
jgi:amidase